MQKSTPPNDFTNYNLDRKETLEWVAHGLGVVSHTAKGSYRVNGHKLYFLSPGTHGEEYVGHYTDPRRAARRHYNEQI